MQYPLPETIGNPDLFVGREEEFKYLYTFLERIPKRLTTSTVILARRKSGKTAILERVFNILWSNPDMGVIPVFIGMRDAGIWIQEFAIKYYQAFASQCISYFERNPAFISELLSLDDIRKYGLEKDLPFFVRNTDNIKQYIEDKMQGMVWDIASSAPHRFSVLHDKRVLVIIDEFQYLNSHIFTDQGLTNLYESTPGTFHALVESKYAPMLVSGSYVSWMLQLMEEYLEAGRLEQFYISPYLKPDEGLQAVYRYAEHYNKPLTNETAEQINTLCKSDPFFIYYTIKNCPENALQTQSGVIDAVYSELTGKHSRMAKVWAEYINKTVDKINDLYAKKILLHLCKFNEKTWTPESLKNELGIELSKKEIHIRLEQLLEADLIEDGGSDIEYQGLTDGTLYLVLRHRFEKEIEQHKPDFKTDFQKQIDQLEKEKKSLRGRLSQLVGKFAEYQLATDMRTRKRFSLSVYFSDIKERKTLNIIDVKLHVKFQRDDGKEMEIDIMAMSDCNRAVLIEVKKWKNKVGVQVIRDFIEKTNVYQRQTKKIIISAILAAGGFSAQAKKLCQEKKVGMADRMAFLK
jgi:hypothetical protein